MRYVLFASLLLLSSLSLWGCTEEGHSGDCSAGGRGNLEEDGCITPIGGACLAEEEFKANRPARRETTSGREVTVDEDWAAYQCVRPLCGECFTEEEFDALDCDKFSWNEYQCVRPLCGECVTEEEFDALDCDGLDRSEYLEMRPECAD